MAVEPIEITYDLTYDDYRQALRRVNRSMRLLVDVFGLGMLGIGTLCVAFPTVGDLLGGESLYFIIGLLLLIAPRLSRWRAARRLWPETSRLSGSGVMRFDDSQITQKTNLIHAQYDWSVFTSFEQTTDLLLLHLPHKRLLVIPRRCMDSSAKTEALLNIFKAKLPELGDRKAPKV
jgi:hypothetical protein